MNSYARKGLYCALLVGGFSLLGIGAANAADTSGDDAVASGTQIVTPVTAPVDVDQNAISVVGNSSTGGAPDAAPQAAADSGPDGSSTTSGTDGVASGTQVPAEITAPVTVTGNAISVVGDSSAESSGGTSAPVDSSAGDTATTSGSGGVASGTQAPLSASAPVTASGNAITVLGDSSTWGSTGAAATGDTGSAPATSGATGSSTSGSDGVASGTQVPLGASAPVAANGNAVSLVGHSSTGSPAASGSGSGSGSGGGGDASIGGDGSTTTATGDMQAGTRGVASAGAMANENGTVQLAGSSGTVHRAALSAAAFPTALAFTGSEPMPLLGLAVLFPLIGFGLLMGARRLGSKA